MAMVVIGTFVERGVGMLRHRRKVQESQAQMVSATLVTMRNFRRVGWGILISASCCDTKIIAPFSLPNSIEKRDVVPSPIVVPPSQYFEGVDGSWSTFIVRVGSPAQSVKVLASTNSPDTIVVRPEGCLEGAIPEGVPSNCASARGGTFNSSLSTSWSEQGWYGLNGIQYGFEANLGYKFNLDYGVDRLGLGFEDGDAPVLENQTIAGYNLPNPLYLGLFGLGTQPVIYSTFGNFSAPSYFVTLRNQSLIPSLSWSYTAGASYRFNAGQFAQLIFGGYDTSRYQPNDVSFQLRADTVLGLLPTPIYAFIESTDPNIWLPLSACLLFEQAFGLQYDNITQKYLMNNTQFTTLSATNPSVSFRLASSTTGGSTTDITLPFYAFGLRAAYPFVPNATYYFPLKRAENSTQYTLGRAFLQEAYLTVDYDRGNFSVSQCTWVDGAKSAVNSILSPSYSTNNTNGTLTTSPKVTNEIPIGPIVGGVLGGVAVLMGICAALFWYCLRKQRREPKLPQGNSTPHVTLEELGHSDADKIFCTDTESVAGSQIRRAPPSIDTLHSRYEADGLQIYQLSAETSRSELGDTDSYRRYELECTSPVVII
ncbi:hypothetical protein BP6252_11189 [Coleophoma cylindrospora]|uniref:Peptidase A1 domain-containing protein n=1 Tax=Coleophoma cylindrospora TaxID=1849047 RepID=A0A3D8QQ95_9HELO|nr:hypothetical protein BP6252_11189 [Coleophoma cylindrospora]